MLIKSIEMMDLSKVQFQESSYMWVTRYGLYDKRRYLWDRNCKIIK